MSAPVKSIAKLRWEAKDEARRVREAEDERYKAIVRLSIRERQYQAALKALALAIAARKAEKK